MSKKKYYFPDINEIDGIFGGITPVCIDYAEIKRLAREFGRSISELKADFHEATAEEIEEYGVYNS